MSRVKPSPETRLNLSAGRLSVAVAALLVAAKLWGLSQTGSLAIAAALADSALDLIVSLGGLIAIAYAARPADDDHHFGHSSAEDLASLAQSLFIVASAGLIGWVAVNRLMALEVPLPRNEAQGIAVMIFAIVLTAGLVSWQRYVARRTGNRVVAADSLHYVGDLVPNLGALLALWLSARFGLARVDSVVALGAALFLAWGALRIGKASWDALMDRQADPEMIAGIERIAEAQPGIDGCHDIRTRVAGSRIFVNLHVEIDGNLTLTEAHRIGEDLRRAVVAAYPGADVLIHKDPAGEPD